MLASTTSSSPPLAVSAELRRAPRAAFARRCRAGTRTWLALIAGLLAASMSEAQVATRPADVAPDAQQGAPAISDLQQLLDVEVQSVFGASKSLQRTTEAPAAVTVITAEEIEHYGWLTLADVLRNVRGFYITSDRTYEYIGTRGFLRPGDYGTRTLITVDGHRLNDNVFDQANIGVELPVDVRDVERIEIIRGPSSSLYGSSAFFGVINLVTRAPSEGPGVEVSTTLGSLGRREGRIRARREFRSGVGLSVSGSGLRIDGVKNLYFPEFDQPDTNLGIATGRDGTSRSNLLAKLQYGALSVTTGFNSRTQDVPTGAYGSSFNQPTTMLDRHALLDVSWNHAVGGGWTAQLRGAYDDYGFAGTYSVDWDGNPATPDITYVDRADGNWWTGEVQLSRVFSGRHQFTTGVENRRNVAQHQFSYLQTPHEPLWDDQRHSSTVGVYVQDQWHVTERLLVNAGLRQDHYSRFSDPLKPRIAVILQPRDATTVKLVYGSAFRAPNVFESYYDFPGLYEARPQLTTEQIRTVEAVVEHYVGRRLRLSGSAFRYAVNRLITFTENPTNGLLSFANLGAVHASGLEAEAEAKWPSGLQARGSYAFSRGRDTESGATLSNSPRHVAQWLLAIPLAPGTFLSADTQALSGRLSRTGASVPGYFHSNLTLTHQLTRPRLRLGVTVGNVTGETHVDPVGDDFPQDVVRQDGRSARLQATWAF